MNKEEERDSEIRKELCKREQVIFIKETLDIKINIPFVLFGVVLSIAFSAV